MLIRTNVRIGTIECQNRHHRHGPENGSEGQQELPVKCDDLRPSSFSLLLRMGVRGFVLVVVAGGLPLGGILDLDLYRETYLDQTPNYSL